MIQFWDVCEDGRKRLVDMVRDRLNPAEREDAIFDMWDKWADDRFVELRYETYGQDEGAWRLEQEMHTRGKLFSVIPVRGLQDKLSRIYERLVAPLKNSEVFFPDTMVKECRYTNLTRSVL